MTYRLRNIAVAVGLALVAALLTTFYVTTYKRHVRQSEATVQVYVARHDIPQGTPGATIVARGWLGTEDVAQRTVVPGAISSPTQIEHLLSTEPVYAGEQLTLRPFADDQELGVRAQLHGTTRAVSLTGTADQVLTGTLREGDHVDVLADLKTGSCTTCFAVRDIARGLLVLSAPQTPSGPTRLPGQDGSVLLAVDDHGEAQKLFFAVENAQSWSLELRPAAGATDSHEDVETAKTELDGGLTKGGGR